MYHASGALKVILIKAFYYCGFVHTGPAKSLFAVEYYQSMRKALKSDGVLCCQGECQWLHLDLIKNIMSFCRDLFPVTSYAYTTIPTYPSGQIGFILCGNSKVSKDVCMASVCVCVK